MSAHTDPDWWLILWIVLGSLLGGILWTLVSIPLAILFGRAMSDRRAEDQQTAADWGEPTREEVEKPFRVYDDSFLDEPIYQEFIAKRHDDEVEEAMAEVDIELPVVLDGRWPS